MENATQLHTAEYRQGADVFMMHIEYREYTPVHDAPLVSAELHQSHEAVRGGAGVESLQPARR